MSGRSIAILIMIFVGVLLALVSPARDVYSTSIQQPSSHVRSRLLPAVNTRPNVTQQSPRVLPDKLMLNILWRVLLGPDYMTTWFGSDCNTWPCQAVFYVPRNPIPGITGPLYRWYNHSVPDHLDATTDVTCCGYVLENGGQPFGHPWSNNYSARGLWEVQSAYNPYNGDHALQNPWFPIGGQYVTEGPMNRWGYPRYGNVGESLLQLGAGGVTIQSNGVAGGSLWRWYYRNMQYVSLADTGRQIQSALFYWAGLPWQSVHNNPTEAGNEFGWYGLDPAKWHGSPVLNIHNDLTNPSRPKQITRSVPMEWATGHPHHGGGPDNPILYPDIVLGKDIELNYAGMGPVAKYTTHLYLPTSVPYALLQIPSTWLRGNFERFWKYNAVTQQLTEAFPLCNTYPPVLHFVDYGGVIVSDQSGSNAMGLFGVNRSLGGSVTAFSLWNFTKSMQGEQCFAGGTGETDGRTGGMDATIGYWDPNHTAGRVTLPAGWSSYETWVITGTISEVTQKMNALYCLFSCIGPGTGK